MLTIVSSVPCIVLFYPITFATTHAIITLAIYPIR